MSFCEKCPTPLDEGGRCVTCDAAAEGLLLVARHDFASVREMMATLELAGLGPEMERVPPARPEERAQPRWNLYVPEAEQAQARDVLRRDWAGLLEDEEAAEAARRGAEALELAPGADVSCPACGERFAVPAAGEVECPGCGLGLGPAGLPGPSDAKE